MPPRRERQAQEPTVAPEVAAAVAAAQAGGTTAPAAAPALAAPAQVAAVTSLLAALAVFHQRRREHNAVVLFDWIRRHDPQVTQHELDVIAAQEQAFAQAFGEKQAERVQADVAEALKLPPIQRDARLEQIKDRERRYLEQHEEAQLLRAIGHREMQVVRARSPEGAKLVLGKGVSKHTPGCVALSRLGALPWRVWEVLGPPPYHALCACHLEPLSSVDVVPDEAAAVDRVKATIERLRDEEPEMASRLTEASIDDRLESIGVHLAQRGASRFYDSRWPRGTEHGGQFRPRRGGVAGRKLRPPEALRRDADKVAAKVVDDTKGLRARVRAALRGDLDNPLPVGTRAGWVRALEAEGFQHVGTEHSLRHGLRYERHTFIHPDGARIEVWTDGHSIRQSSWRRTEPAGARSQGWPASWEDTRADALAFAGQLAGRYGTHTSMRDLAVEPGISDLAAITHADGRIGIGPDAPRAMADPEGSTSLAYRAAATIAHEVLHTVNPIPMERYLTSGPDDPAAQIEEALVEELSHVMAIDRLREWGRTDVLTWVRSHPHDLAVVGEYQVQRNALRELLDEAHVPPEARRALLERLKFAMGPDERVSALGHLVGSEDRVRKAFASQLPLPVGDHAPVLASDFGDLPPADLPVVEHDGARLGIGAVVDFNWRGQPFRATVADMDDTEDIPNWLTLRLPDGSLFGGIHPQNDGVQVVAEPGAAMLSGIELRVGDRFAYTTGGKRVEATVEAILRSDPEHPSLTARTAAGEHVVLTEGSVDRVEWIDAAGMERPGEVRSWDDFPLDARTGQGPRAADTPPERTPDGSFVLYHGTSAESAARITQEGRLRPDDIETVGVTTTPGQAQSFAAIKGGADGVVLRLEVPPSALEGLHAQREVGGSGRDQFLLNRGYGFAGPWDGIAVANVQPVEPVQVRDGVEWRPQGMETAAERLTALLPEGAVIQRTDTDAFHSLHVSYPGEPNDQQAIEHGFGRYKAGTGYDIGWLTWNSDSGKIERVGVQPKFRRQGIATAMLVLAREQADTEGLARPEHSTLLTPDATAWIEALAERGMERPGAEAVVFENTDSPADIRARIEAMGPDDELWVFHATDRETAERFKREGVTIADKPVSLARERYEAGEDAIFQPGAGIGAGLTVAARVSEVGGYGRHQLALRIRKRDLALPPEQQGTTPADAVAIGDGMTMADIAPENIVEVTEPGKDPTVIDNVGERIGMARPGRSVADDYRELPEQTEDTYGPHYYVAGGCAALALAFKGEHPEMKLAVAWVPSGAEHDDGSPTRAFDHVVAYDPATNTSYDGFGSHTPAESALWDHQANEDMDADPSLIADHFRLEWNPEEPFRDPHIIAAYDEVIEPYFKRGMDRPGDLPPFAWTSREQIPEYGMSFESFGDAVPGGYNFVYQARSPDGEYLGHIRINTAGDEGTIANIQVQSDHQREGIATKMLDWTRRANPDLRIEHGWQTEEGAAWRRSLPPEWQDVIPSWNEQHGLPPGTGTTMARPGTTTRTLTHSWHLTDDPKFSIDTTKRPFENYTMTGGDAREPGLYVTSDPLHWFDGYDYVRPFVAEIEHPPVDAKHDGMAFQGLLTGDNLRQAKVVRVIPFDEWVRETFNEPGKIEDFNQDTPEARAYSTPEGFSTRPDNPPIPPDYHYEGPDVRDMSPEQTAEFQRRADKLLRSRLLAKGMDPETGDYPATTEEMDRFRAMARPGVDEGAPAEVVAMFRPGEPYGAMVDDLRAIGVDFAPPNVSTSEVPAPLMREVVDVVRQAHERYPILTGGPGRSLRRVLTLTADDPTVKRLLPIYGEMMQKGNIVPLSIAAGSDWNHVALVINDMDPLAPTLHENPAAIEQLSAATASGYTGSAWHEVAHALMYASGQDHPMLTTEEREQRHTELMERFDIDPAEVAALSPYAATTPLEGLAELSAMYHLRAARLDRSLREKAGRLFRYLGGDASDREHEGQARPGASAPVRAEDGARRPGEATTGQAQAEAVDTIRAEAGIPPTQRFTILADGQTTQGQSLSFADAVGRLVDERGTSTRVEARVMVGSNWRMPTDVEQAAIVRAATVKIMGGEGMHRPGEGDGHEDDWRSFDLPGGESSDRPAGARLWHVTDDPNLAADWEWKVRQPELIVRRRQGDRIRPGKPRAPRKYEGHIYLTDAASIPNWNETWTGGRRYAVEVEIEEAARAREVRKGWREWRVRSHKTRAIRSVPVSVAEGMARPGMPDVLYHGTGSQRADEIRRDGFRPGDDGGNVVDTGSIWFTSDSKQARLYAVARGGKGKPTVLEARVNLKRPLMFDRSVPVPESYFNDTLREAGIDPEKAQPFWTDAVQEAGFDGIVLKRIDGVTDVEVFDPSRVELMADGMARPALQPGSVGVAETEDEAKAIQARIAKFSDHPTKVEQRDGWWYVLPDVSRPYPLTYEPGPGMPKPGILPTGLEVREDLGWFNADGEWMPRFTANGTDTLSDPRGESHSRVAYLGGEPIASVTWVTWGEMLMLGTAYTKPEFRQRGIFNKLTEDVRASGKRVDAFVWDNPDLKRVVRGWGMWRPGTAERPPKRAEEFESTWDTGDCAAYALATADLFPDLRLGSAGPGPGEVGHFFAHDDASYYDVSGEHPLTRWVGDRTVYLELNMGPDRLREILWGGATISKERREAMLAGEVAQARKVIQGEVDAVSGAPLTLTERLRRVGLSDEQITSALRQIADANSPTAFADALHLLGESESRGNLTGSEQRE